MSKSLCHVGRVLLLRFFGKYLAMDVITLLPEFYGSVTIFDWLLKGYLESNCMVD